MDSTVSWRGKAWQDGTLKRVIAELGVSNEEELFAAIGSEKYSVKQVVEKI